jgi:predicted ArsR family transcriptional regulator
VDRKHLMLRHLKTSGEARLAELAAEAGMTKQGALRHLERLEAAGLVERGSVHPATRRAGRPEHVYRLTPAGVESFPSAYRQLAGDLAAAMPPEQLAAFFERRAGHLEADYGPRLAGLNFEERVSELTRAATDNGHMAELRRLPDGALELRHCNCPIQEVAARTGHPCQHELNMYERLLGAEVVRTSWVGNSDPNCTYQITEKEQKS